MSDRARIRPDQDFQPESCPSEVSYAGSAPRRVTARITPERRWHRCWTGGFSPMRSVGTVLLALGFLALSTSVLVRDPTAPDANIGAGLLDMVGIVTGATGLLALISARFTRSTECDDS